MNQLHDPVASLDPKLLLTFREVARMGSISAAARKLGWTQPALGAQMKKLERDAGTPLISRHARGISLTPAGEVLLGHADAIAGRLLVAQAALRDAVQGRVGRLAIATFPSGASAIVGPAAAKLMNAVNPPEVRIAEMEPPLAVEALMEGQVDAALIFQHEEDGEELPGDAAHLRVTVLGRDELLLALPATHPLAQVEGPVPADDLAGVTWISGCLWCQANLAAFGQRRGFTPEVRFTSEDQLVVQELVAADLGVALISRMTWEICRRPGVVVRHLEEPLSRTISLVTHRHDPRRTVRLLVEHTRLAGQAVGLT